MIAFWLSQGASLARPFRDAVATRNSAETNAAAQESCSSLAPGVTDLPIERIKEVVQPTGDQLAALNELSAAAAKANDIIKASCPTAVPLTPLARRDAVEARLEAVNQAADIVRGLLQAFYGSLSDEQKQRFDKMGSKGKRQAPAGGDITALCGQQSADTTNLPIQRIDQVVSQGASSSRMHSRTSSKHRVIPPTNCSRPARRKYRGRQWSGSIRSRQAAGDGRRDAHHSPEVASLLCLAQRRPEGAL